jgi:zinc protease
VREERAAVNAGDFADFRRLSGAMLFLAIDNQGVAPARVEQLLNEEVEKVRTDTIPQEELTKAQRQYRAGAIRDRQTTMGVAEALQHALWFEGSLEAVNQDVQRHLAVTTADLARVARKYLAPENRLTIIVNPPAGRGAAQ